MSPSRVSMRGRAPSRWCGGQRPPSSKEPPPSLAELHGWGLSVSRSGELQLSAVTSIGNPGWGQLGDAAACLLADGRLLIGNLSDGRTALYDPTTNTWTATGSMAARSNE